MGAMVLLMQRTKILKWAYNVIDVLYVCRLFHFKHGSMLK